jgi:hypothetical protein
VTSATTSDGTATLNIEEMTVGQLNVSGPVVLSGNIDSTTVDNKISLLGGGLSGFVAPSYYAVSSNSASLREGSSELACLTWGASGAQNLTVPSGTALTFNNTSYTFGTGAASAMKTALAIASADITDATIDGYTNPGKLLKTDASTGSVSVGGLGITNAIGSASFSISSLTDDRTYTFPDASGTFALTTDIPPVEVKSANFTAANKGDYIATATLTVTDPTPSEGAAFRVFVRNGTATVGGTAYSVAGTVIERVYHSGSWANYPYSSALFGANVATFLATPLSDNLRAAVTDETGTGSLVFATSPTINTPTVRNNSASFTPLSIGTGGTHVATFADNVNAVSGLQMGNVNTGNAADFRFLIKDTTDHYFAFSVPSTGNALTLFGLNRNATDYIFNSGGTARDICIGTLDAKAVVFGTNATERARITSTGSFGIGTATPNAKALIDLTSTTQGFLPPRMTTAQRDAITSVPAGLMIYNTTTNKLNVYTTAWEAITSA